MDSQEKDFENDGPNFVLVKEDKAEDEKEVIKEVASPDSTTEKEAKAETIPETEFQNNDAPKDDAKEKHKKPRKDPKFVTMKALVIALIIAVVSSSVLTGAIMAHFAGGSSAGKKVISATNYTLAKETGSELSIQEVIAMNENAVVEIRTESIDQDSWLSNYVKTGAGSGVIIDNKGYILTCNHVVEGASKIDITLRNGEEYQAEMIGTDPQNDVAVVKIKGGDFTAAQYGDSKKIGVGDMVVALGNPLGQLGGSASAGIISALDRELTIEGRKMSLLQTDTSINPGNSGGGLFDAHGNLIGIVVAKSAGSDVEGLGFAIPINTAAEIAKDLIENGHVTNRPAIGVTLLDASNAQVAIQYGLRNTGVYIKEVNSKEAKKAGLKVGDMLYFFGEDQIQSFPDLQSALLKYKPGDDVHATVIRDGETVDLTLHLIEMQPE